MMDGSFPPVCHPVRPGSGGDLGGLPLITQREKKKVVLTLTFPPIRSGGSSSVSKATLMVAKGRLAICCISLSSC